MSSHKNPKVQLLWRNRQHWADDRRRSLRKKGPLSVLGVRVGKRRSTWAELEAAKAQTDTDPKAFTANVSSTTSCSPWRQGSYYPRWPQAPTTPCSSHRKPHSCTLLTGPWRLLAGGLLEIHRHRPGKHTQFTGLFSHNLLHLPLDPTFSGRKSGWHQN